MSKENVVLGYFIIENNRASLNQGIYFYAN